MTASQQKKIWNLLKGQSLLAKEIASELGGRASEDSVRQQIRKMLGKGWPIGNTPGGGYFREDAPPPDGM